MLANDDHLDTRNDSYRLEQIRSLHLNAQLGRSMAHSSFNASTASSRSSPWSGFRMDDWNYYSQYRIVRFNSDLVLHMLEQGRDAELLATFDDLLTDHRNDRVLGRLHGTQHVPGRDRYATTYEKFLQLGRVRFHPPSWTWLVGRPFVCCTRNRSIQVARGRSACLGGATACASSSTSHTTPGGP